MSAVLSVEHLCKEYPKFKLEEVTFAVERGSIMGLIGRNGAGKTTTLKSPLGLVHPTSGRISFFGQAFGEHEAEIKSRIGYAAGGTHYYQKKRIRDITAVTRGFYPTWDEETYRRCLERFALDEDKRLCELSEGMKVKFGLTSALSHRAELLILDEPTSGLDPVSRDELLEVFLDLAAEGTAILFSTHITSDLDKCADAITYIREGREWFSGKTDDFVTGYRLPPLAGGWTEEQRSAVLGICRDRTRGTALIRSDDGGAFPGAALTAPTLEEIMVHLEKEGQICAGR